MRELLFEDEPIIDFMNLQAVMAYPEDKTNHEIFVKLFKEDYQDYKVKNEEAFPRTSPRKNKLSKNVKKCIIAGGVLFMMKLLHDENLAPSVRKAIHMQYMMQDNEFPWINVHGNTLKVSNTNSNIRKIFQDYMSVSHFGAAYWHICQKPFSMDDFQRIYSPSGLKEYIAISKTYLDFICEYIPKTQKKPYISKHDIWFYNESDLALVSKDFELNSEDKSWLIETEKEARVQIKVAEQQKNKPAKK